MTRRLLILIALTATLLFSGVVADSPAPAAGAAMVPRLASHATALEPPTVDIRLGGGILQIRIRACGSCRSEVSIRFELYSFAADLFTR
jgi:hypothetical protein